MKRPRVLRADDHPLILDGLQSLLETESQVVSAATVGSGRLRKSVWECQPPTLLRPTLVLLASYARMILVQFPDSSHRHPASNQHGKTPE
jgi:hypothetical protein